MLLSFFFFFNDTATTEIYTLSLHDALPIWIGELVEAVPESDGGESALQPRVGRELLDRSDGDTQTERRSEEHTSELQSRQYLVCRLLLEKKKKLHNRQYTYLTIRTIAYIIE